MTDMRDILSGKFAMFILVIIIISIVWISIKLCERSKCIRAADQCLLSSKEQKFYVSFGTSSSSGRMSSEKPPIVEILE
jgi:hypothetical protein